MNCVRLFIVEEVSVFQDIDIALVFACNWIGQESIPSAGVCSRVVACPRIFFSICHWCHLGNVTSRHCDYQRKIGPFVRMMYNFQLICGNDVWFSAKLWGKSTYFYSLEIWGLFVGSARLWESAPFVGLTLSVRLTYIISIHFNFKQQPYFTIYVWAISKYWKEVNLSLQFIVGLFVLIKLVLVYGFGFKPVLGFTTICIVWYLGHNDDHQHHDCLLVTCQNDNHSPGDDSNQNSLWMYFLLSEWNNKFKITKSYRIQITRNNFIFVHWRPCQSLWPPFFFFKLTYIRTTQTNKPHPSLVWSVW